MLHSLGTRTGLVGTLGTLGALGMCVAMSSTLLSPALGTSAAVVATISSARLTAGLAVVVVDAEEDSASQTLRAMQSHK